MVDKKVLVKKHDKQWHHSQRIGNKAIVNDFVDVPEQLPIEDWERKHPEYAHWYKRSKED